MNIAENGYTNVKRAASGDKEFLIIKKQGFIGIPLKEDEAENICRYLAIYLGLKIIDTRENISMLKNKSNINDGKSMSLVVEHS